MPSAQKSPAHNPSGRPQPGELTEQARRFLDGRFARDSAGHYAPHQPVNGLDGSGEAGQLLRLARSYRLVRWLEALNPASVIDLGAAEGYIANLTRLRTGCATLCVDLSRQACDRAAETYGQPAIAAAVHDLPLASKSADVVILSEVFEHLEEPLTALSEALRVARRYIIFTTQECCASRYEQWLHLALRDPAEPHTELNHVTRADLTALFKPPLKMAPQFRRSLRRLLEQVSPADRPGHLKWLAAPAGWRSSEGVIMVASLDGSPVPDLPPGDDPELWQLLIDGPPQAPAQQPPWEWLSDSEPPVAGLVLEYRREITRREELHPRLNPAGAQGLERRLAMPDRPPTPRLIRALSILVRLTERLGYLTGSDPWPVKLRWLLRRSLLAGK